MVAGMKVTAIILLIGILPILSPKLVQGQLPSLHGDENHGTVKTMDFHPLTSSSGDCETGAYDYYANFLRMAQWLATQQQEDGGVQEAEDYSLTITDNTAESIWTWSCYAQLTGDYTAYLQNINNAWDFCYANPSWEESCSDWLGQEYSCYYTVYNVGWGLLAEMKYREVYEGRPEYIDRTWYGEQCANTLFNYTLGTGSTIDALCLGLAAGALHQYGVNDNNSLYRQKAAELGNNVRQWLEADTSRFASENWAVSAGIAVWGVLNSYFKENSGGDIWAKEFAPYIPANAHDGLNNDYQYGHDGWYAWGRYAVSEALDSADYFDSYRNIVDCLFSVDGDKDGGIPQGSTETDNQDHAWVTNVAAFALNLGLLPQNLPAPYVHQCYDTPEDFCGSEACGATSAVMLLAAYNRIIPWSNEHVNGCSECGCTIEHDNASDFGNYVSKEYTCAGTTWNEATYDYGNNHLSKGAYGYIHHNSSP